MTPKNILVLTYWDYDDALIQTYTLPYLKIIAQHITKDGCIYLLTLNKKNSSVDASPHTGIKIIPFRYIPFGFTAILYYTWMIFYLLIFIFRKNITHLHAWCTPAGMFAYILSIITRKPLVIDSYEPHAETMTEVEEWGTKSLAFRILFYFEKKMTHHARYLIATTQGMITEYAVMKYGYQPKKNNWFVKPACVDFNLFQPDEKERKKLLDHLPVHNKIVGIYVGKLGSMYLENEFFEWLKCAQDFWKDNFCFILLSPQSSHYIQSKMEKFSVDDSALIHRFVPHHQVVHYLSIATFAINVIKPVYSKKFCTPIKNGEYWAMGLPVIITKNISTDSDIIEKYNIGTVLDELNVENYRRSVLKIDQILKSHTKDELFFKIRTIAKKYRNFEIAHNIYKEIYG